MLELEATFEKLLGRQPSEKEVQSLYRVKNALNIRDNDALWLVLMALESYDTLYRKYPVMIASEVAQIVEDQRTVMAALAEAETRKALGTLADTVSKTSESIAVRLADATRWQSWGWAWFTFSSFGSLCVFVGVVLGTGRLPYWASPAPDQGVIEVVLGVLARTPAGWIAAIGGAAGAVAALWRARHEIMAGQRFGLLAGGLALLALSVTFLWPILRAGTEM